MVSVANYTFGICKCGHRQLPGPQ